MIKIQKFYSTMNDKILNWYSKHFKKQVFSSMNEWLTMQQALAWALFKLIFFWWALSPNVLQGGGGHLGRCILWSKHRAYSKVSPPPLHVSTQHCLHSTLINRQWWIKGKILLAWDLSTLPLLIRLFRGFIKYNTRLYYQSRGVESVPRDLGAVQPCQEAIL